MAECRKKRVERPSSSTENESNGFNFQSIPFAYSSVDIFFAAIQSSILLSVFLSHLLFLFIYFSFFFFIFCVSNFPLRVKRREVQLQDTQSEDKNRLKCHQEQQTFPIIKIIIKIIINTVRQFVARILLSLSLSFSPILCSLSGCSTIFARQRDSTHNTVLGWQMVEMVF